MNKKQVLGIDVSFCQGPNLDFDKIKNAGIKFVICKATHGSNPISIDPTFVSNWKKLNNKIPRGAYMWYVPGTDPIKQADHFVDTILKNGFNDNDLPPTIDFEQNTTVPPSQLLDGVIQCVKRIKERTNRKVIFYTGKWYWSGFVKDLDAPELLEITYYWHAEYPSTRRIGTEYAAALELLPSPHPAFPWASRKIEPLIWQFDGNKGLILPGGVDSDFNRFNGDDADFAQWIKDSIIKQPIVENPPIEKSENPPIEKSENPPIEKSENPPIEKSDSNQESEKRVEENIVKLVDKKSTENENILAIILTFFKTIIQFIFK